MLLRAQSYREHLNMTRNELSQYYSNYLDTFRWEVELLQKLYFIILGTADVFKNNKHQYAGVQQNLRKSKENDNFVDKRLEIIIQF